MKKICIVASKYYEDIINMLIDNLSGLSYSHKQQHLEGEYSKIKITVQDLLEKKINKALANKRRKESIAKDRVHGFVPHGAIKNHQHTFYWPKQPMMATTTPNNESEKENPNKNDKSTFAADHLGQVQKRIGKN